jgi:hypothetical protein
MDRKRISGPLKAPVRVREQALKGSEIGFTHSQGKPTQGILHNIILWQKLWSSLTSLVTTFNSQNIPQPFLEQRDLIRILRLQKDTNRQNT